MKELWRVIVFTPFVFGSVVLWTFMIQVAANEMYKQAAGFGMAAFGCSIAAGIVGWTLFEENGL